MNEPQFPSNHNLQSLPPEEQARLAIETALEIPRARWAQLEAAVERAVTVVENETQAENFTTAIAQLQALAKRIGFEHDRVKEPWLAAARMVDNLTNVLLEKVELAKSNLQARLTAYQIAKQQRVEEERERIRAAEADDPEPAYVDHAKVDKARVRVRSVEGAIAHLAQKIEIEIVDVKAIPDRYFARERVRKALIAEILPDVRKGDQVDGVKRIEGLESRVKA